MAHTPQDSPEDAHEDDAVLTRIGQAVMLHRGGDREEARNRLATLWQEMAEDEHPLHRCTLAHYLADTQDDPADELMWDLLALAAADSGDAAPDGADGGDGGDGTGGGGDDGGRTAARPASRAVRVLYPSLHLNLAADYVKLGQEAAARRELSLARASSAELGDDAYGRGIRSRIGRLALRLDGEIDGPPGAAPS